MATKLFSRSKVKAVVTATVNIDYPQEGEAIQPGHYAVRISSTGTGRVEVAVNKGAWQGCRFDSLYSWFDWFPEKSGKQRLEAQVILNDGSIVKSAVKSCTVKKFEQN